MYAQSTIIPTIRNLGLGMGIGLMAGFAGLVLLLAA